MWAFSFGVHTLSCGMHAGSSSLTRDRTPGPLHWEHGVLPTGPPGSPLNTFIIRVSFIIDSLRFARYKIISPENRNIFISSCPFHVPLIGFSCLADVAGEWDTRGWSCPRSQVSPWDGPPSEGAWICTGKNSRVSSSKVKAGLFREIHTL